MAKIETLYTEWLLAMPLPDFSKWSKSCQEEILVFSEYMSQFRSWIALASDVFAFEIESSIRHPDELHMGGLKPAQQLRSSRLLAMLQQIFIPYLRAHMLIQAYVEGISVDGIFVATRGTSGFERWCRLHQCLQNDHNFNGCFVRFVQYLSVERPASSSLFQPEINPPSILRSLVKLHKHVHAWQHGPVAHLHIASGHSPAMVSESVS